LLADRLIKVLEKNGHGVYRQINGEAYENDLKCNEKYGFGMFWSTHNNIHEDEPKK
jgi:hypothetical protein